MDPNSRAAKKNTSHGNEVLPQDTTHLIPVRTTRRPLDHRKETHTAVVWNVSRLSGPAKTILQGTVKGGRRQDRQRKRWEDNIREWTGLEFRKSQRAVKNKEKMEERGCEIICGTIKTLAVKE